MLRKVLAVPVQRCLNQVRRNMAVCVVAQHDNKTLDFSVANAVKAASSLDKDLTVLVAGKGCQEVAKQASLLQGVTRVVLTDHAAYEHGLCENLSALVVDLQNQKKFSHIVTAATAFGKNFLPYTGAKLDTNPVGDVTKILSADTFVRPIYAGNALATVKSTDLVKLLSVRATSFEAAVQASSAAPVEAFTPTSTASGSTAFVENKLNTSDRPELASAKVVISGGRGMGDGKNFKMLEDLADLLGGAVGASRAAVDAGMVPNDMQVGQTGKVVAPNLYVAVGISGAIQHLAGMKDSKVIVAINKDAEAPIFQVADYGLVGDLFQAVPELTASLKK